MGIFNLGGRHSDQGGMLRNEGLVDRQFKKVIQWYNKDKDTMSYRYDVSHSEVMDGSVLIVQEGQVALLSNDGIIEVFEAGRYELSTDNKPVTSTLKSIFFKFENTHKQTIYFVTKRQFVGNKWGTKNPATLMDPQFGPVQIRAFGSYIFKIGDPKAFYLELSGSDKEYTRKDINEQLSAFIEESLAAAVNAQGMTALHVSTRLNEVSAVIEQRVIEQFSAIGLEIKNVVVESVSLPQDVQDAINKSSKVNILGSIDPSKMPGYSQVAMLDALENASEHSGGAMFAQAGMGLGLGMYGSQMVGQTLNTAMQQPQKSNTKGKFCPECGTAGEDSAKFCLECGHKFTTSGCSCGAEIKPGQKFCMNCGSKI